MLSQYNLSEMATTATPSSIIEDDFEKIIILIEKLDLSADGTDAITESGASLRDWPLVEELEEVVEGSQNDAIDDTVNIKDVVETVSNAADEIGGDDAADSEADVVSAAVKEVLNVVELSECLPTSSNWHLIVTHLRLRAACVQPSRNFYVCNRRESRRVLAKRS